MKDLAKLLVQNRLAVRRTQLQNNPNQNAPITDNGNRTNPQKVPEITTTPKTSSPTSVYQDFDSWRPEEEDVSDLADHYIPQEGGNFRKPIGRPKYKNQRKKRGVCITMSVSEEEAEILRRYAASIDLTFSEWARSALFAAIGKNVPKRPRTMPKRNE